MAGIATRTDPAVSFEAVTPSDTVNFPGGPARSLYVGTGGDVAAVDAAGDAVTFVSVPAGTILPVQCVRVNATNTSASNIVALR